MSDIEKLENMLEQYGKEFQVAHEALDQTLPEDKQGFLLGNWNDLPDWIIDKLEEDWELEWEDENDLCSHCHKMVRTQPDCWFWTPQYVILDGDLICRDCLDENPDWLDEYIDTIKDDPKQAFPLDEKYLSSRGFLKMNEKRYENGLHPHMNDKPDNILVHFQALYPECDFVFTYFPSQFHIEFNVWSRAKGYEKRKEEAERFGEEQEEERSNQNMG